MAIHTYMHDWMTMSGRGIHWKLYILSKCYVLTTKLSLSNEHINYLLKVQRNHPHSFINSLKLGQWSIFTIFARTLRIFSRKSHKNLNIFSLLTMTNSSNNTLKNLLLDSNGHSMLFLKTYFLLSNEYH